MSWLTPDVIDIILTVVKAIVILLVVVACGAFMSFAERRLLGLWPLRAEPRGLGRFAAARRGYDQNVL